MFKTCKIISLKTNDTNPAYYQFVYEWPEGIIKEYTLKPKSINCEHHNFGHHLYITSDDEIKEGDWFYNFQTNRIIKAKVDESHYLSKKIISTTDSSLQYHDKTPIGENVNGLWKCLPQPSQAFIEKYVEEYNKGQQISDILVEYEEY